MSVLVPAWFRLLDWLRPRQILADGSTGRDWRWHEGDYHVPCPVYYLPEENE